jgi:hypothetical protein
MQNFDDNNQKVTFDFKDSLYKFESSIINTNRDSISGMSNRKNIKLLSASIDVKSNFDTLERNKVWNPNW